jgi:class 3 adenylate cyclase
MKADPETEAAVLSVLREYDEAITRKDVDAILELNSPNIVSFGTGVDERIVGLEELRPILEREVAQGDHVQTEYKWTSVSLHGSLALLATEMEARWFAGGQESSALIRMTAVLEKHDDRWRFLQVHGSLPAAGQQAGEAYPTPIEAVASAVSEERPDLRANVAPDGTVTMLFTDIENSTNLTERLGDTEWMKVLQAHNTIVREQVKTNGCFEIKSLGDGFMIAAQKADDALRCAIGIQRGLARYNEGAAEPINVRMGLHTGEVLKDADDFFGKHVILASRIAGKARGGEILVSSLLRELTESGGDIRFGESREVELKGLSGKHLVHEVMWRLL